MTLLALLLGGVNSAWAQDPDFKATFELDEGWSSSWGSIANMPDGWSIVGSKSDFHLSSANWCKKNGSYGIGWYDSSSSSTNNSSNYLITPELQPGIVKFWAGTYKEASSCKVVVYTCSADGSNRKELQTFAYGNPLSQTPQQVSFELEEASHLAFLLSRAGIDDLEAYYTKIDGPVLTVSDGTTKVKSPYSYIFGLATAGTSHTFTLANAGTAPIEGLSVNETGNFGATLSANSIAAGENVTLKVTMPETSGDSEITISSTTDDVDDFVINVSGTIRDANKVYLDFADGQMPEGWTSVGIGSYTSSSYAWTASTGYIGTSASSSYYSQALTSPKLIFAKDELIAFETARYGTSTWNSPSITVEYSLDGTTWTAIGSAFTDDVYGTWTSRSVIIPVEGVKYIRFNGWYVYLRNIYGGEEVIEPKMVVTQPASLDFGVIAESTPKTFTIANTGKATLEGITVTSSNSSIFAITGAPTSLAAGASAEVTITMSAETKGALSSDITVSATAMEDVKFTVTGVVLPEGLSTEDFADGLPANWTNAGWTFANGEATGKSSSAYLTTPKLKFSEGDMLVIKAKRADNDATDYITVQGSSDNGSTWTAYSKKISGSDGLSYPDYGTIVLSDIPTTVNKLRFVGYYVVVDEILGLTLDDDDPKLVVTDDKDTEISTGARCDLSWVTTSTSATYYIKNGGTGTLEIEGVSSSAVGITAAVADNTTKVAAGESVALTIAMAADDNLGAHAGDVTITTNVGEFKIAVSGVVYDADKLYLDFTTEDFKFPVGWTRGDWQITGEASGTLQTTKLQAAAGEKMIIEAISTGSSWSSPSLSYSYSTDNGENWTAATSVADKLNTNYYTNIVLETPNAEAATDVLVRLTGSNVTVRRIYGFASVKVPVMNVTAQSLAFGLRTAESDEKSFVISNDGEADLTGLSLTLGKTGEEAEYSFRMTNSDETEFTGTTLESGKSVNVYVKQLFNIDNLGSKSDVLTIVADDQASKTVNLSGSTRDGSKLYVDFDDPNAFPEGWQIGADWIVSPSGYAYQNSAKTPSSFITTPLTVAEAETLTFKVARNNTGYGYTTSLNIRYSQDGGANWSEFKEYYNTDEAGSGYTTKQLTDIPAGNVILEFYGSNIKIDNIEGFTLATSPALALTTKEDNAVVLNGSEKDFGNLVADGEVTYVLKNIGNAVLKSTITGEGITVSPANVELPAGEEQEIKVKMAFAQPYGEKTGKMTIVSEGWVGDMTVDFKAVAVDPTNLVVDFEDGKPLGWFSDDASSVYYGWLFANGIVSINMGKAQPLITEMVGAEAGKNVMSFDAKSYYGDDEQTMSVYISTDRMNWGEANEFTLTSEWQTFYLPTLTDGNYYIKFEANNASLDNVKGLKKLAAPARDIYVSASSIPATASTGEVSTSVTVTSLIANETGVYAKLFVNDTEVASTEATAVDVELRQSKNISLPYTITEPGTYSAQIKVYYNDGTEAFATAVTDIVVDYPALTLNERLTSDLKEGTFNITLKRTYNVDGWNTICLPFAVSGIESLFGEGACAYEFSDYNTTEKTLQLTKVSELAAGVPYILFVKNEITDDIKLTAEVTATTAQTVTSNNVSFVGTYASIEAPGMNGKWGVTAAGKIGVGNSSAYIYGFRAYFDGELQNARLAVFDDDVTGIRYLSADQLNNDAIYNLNGQRVETMKKGQMYIKNGKKMIRK